MNKILILLFLTIGLYGQKDTCEGPFNYKSQYEIDKDEPMLSKCSTVQLGISIDGYYNNGRKRLFRSFQAFRNIESLGGYLIIGDAILENSMTGFDKLSIIKKGLILLNVETGGIYGLDSLDQIDGLIMIEDCDVESFGELRNVRGELNSLMIYENRDLHSLDGLQGFNSDTANGSMSLDVVGNPELSSLDGIESIFIPKSGYVYINNNEKLTDCAKKNICEALVNGSTVYISENGPGCNSNKEVLQQCLTGTSGHRRGEVVIYPNPVRNELRIESDSEIQTVAIIDMAGRVCIKRNDINGKIDMNKVPSGVYNLSITTSQQVINRIIFKE